MKRIDFFRGALLALSLAVLLALPGLTAAQDVPAELISYPQTIYTNGKILTADDRFSVVQAVAIRDGKFLAVGTNDQALALKGPDTKVVDLGGKTVIPGMIMTDADNDLVAGNLYKDTLIDRKLGDGVKSLDRAGVLKEMAAIVAKRPAGEVIFLRGQEESMDSYRLTARDLDAVSPKNPLAYSISSSDMIVNTAMLKQVIERIPMGESHPGLIKDAAGRPDGRLYGQATGIVGWDMRPWPVIDETAISEQKKMFTDLHQKGITSMVAHTQGYALSVVNVLYHRNELDMRLFASHDFLRQNPFAEAYLRRLGNLVNFGLGDMVTIVGAGLASADGNGDVGSALTLDPKLRSGGYGFKPHGENKWIGFGENTGSWDDAAVKSNLTEWENVQVAVRYGWNTTGIHNVGDGATQVWLEAIDAAVNSKDVVMPYRFRPFGLDHNMFWNDRNAALMLKNDVRRGLGKVWQYPEKASELYGDKIHDVQPVPQLVAKGFKVHIEDANFEKMQNYITRRDRAGRVWGPDHAIDRPTALKMVTIWAARYIGEEKNIGSIEKGKKADMAILGTDYMTVPETQIGKIPVNAVVVDGRLVYGQP